MTNHPQWQFLNDKATREHLGLLPSFLDLDDTDDAVKQLDKNYRHGGGWHSFKGFRRITGTDYGIQYPGDPAYQPIASVNLRDETIVLYPYSWVAVFQPDGSFDIARMD